MIDSMTERARSSINSEQIFNNMATEFRFLDSYEASQTRSTQIKVCGITRIDDALQIAQCGIDAIGLVFYTPSGRNLSTGQATVIRQCLPPQIAAIAVVVNPEDELLEAITSSVKPDFIQFHGDESESRCREPGIPFIKAIRVQSAQQVHQTVLSYPSASGFLLDAYVKDKVGGTGKTFSWDDVPPIDRPIILAGGLHRGNIAQAIDKIKPTAVDVSSGVETRPGIKSVDAVREFVAAVHGANHRTDPNHTCVSESVL